jgi:hypothetical protein
MKQSQVDVVLSHMGLHKETPIGTITKYTELSRQQVHVAMHTLVKEGVVKKIEREGQPSLFKRIEKTRPKHLGKRSMFHVEQGTARPVPAKEKPDTAIAHALTDAKREQLKATLKPGKIVSVEVEAPEVKPEPLKLDSIADVLKAMRAMLDMVEQRWVAECNAKVESAEMRALEAEDKQRLAEQKLQDLKDLVGSA